MGRFEITTNLKITSQIFFYLTAITLIIGCQSRSSESAEDIPLPKMQPGVEQFDKYIPRLKDKKVALVVNHTSLVNGTHIVDTLLEMGIDIKLAFAPEHGFRGEADDGQPVDSGIDPATGLQIVSLYGKNKKPTPEDLEDIDVVIFDIQDVGTRFYTFISTMHYAMEAAAENEVKFMVLDRPNPNGDFIDGPVRKEGFESFVGMHPIPVVHGLTVGELAMMIKGEGWLANNVQPDLTVIPVMNYDRMERYEPSVKPSPNLPNYNSIRWYPTTCFFEGTVLSEGRGTQHPFEFIGYPDPDMGDFSFTPTSIPGMSTYPKFEDKTCWGIDLRRQEPGRQIELDVILGMYSKFKEKELFFKKYFNTLAGTEELRTQIESGLSSEEIRKSWQPGLEAYKEVRKKYLLYPDLD